MEQEPENPNVIASLNGKYENIMIVDARSPEDICVYFKEQGNEMNLVGAPASFIEDCEKATLIQHAWAHAVKHKLPGSTTPSTHEDYEKDMFKWMQKNYPGAFSSYLEWDKGKQLHKKLSSIPCHADEPNGETLWDVFKAACTLECV